MDVSDIADEYQQEAGSWHDAGQETRHRQQQVDGGVPRSPASLMRDPRCPARDASFLELRPHRERPAWNIAGRRV